MLDRRASKVLLLLIAHIWICAGIGIEAVTQTKPSLGTHLFAGGGEEASRSLNTFRGPIQGSPATARGIGRSVLVSVLLLITVIVTGTYTLRKEDVSKETRECPLKYAFSDDTAVSSCVYKGSKRAAEMKIPIFPDEWMDTLLTSKALQCVFDPDSIILEKLLVSPPPTFIRKMGPESSELNAIIAQFQNLRKTYVSISDGGN